MVNATTEKSLQDTRPIFSERTHHLTLLYLVRHKHSSIAQVCPSFFVFFPGEKGQRHYVSSFYSSSIITSFFFFSSSFSFFSFLIYFFFVFFFFFFSFFFFFFSFSSLIDERRREEKRGIWRSVALGRNFLQKSYILLGEWMIRVVSSCCSILGCCGLQISADIYCKQGRLFS